MNLTIESLLIFFLIVFNASISVFYFQSLLKIRQLNNANIHMKLSNMALSETIQDNELSSDIDIHKENFIKFLSDSRDWAFEYIDQSQKQIKEFIDIADKHFAFFDSYGMLSEGQLFYEDMKIMSEEYKKLKSLLPEEADDRR